MNLRPYQIEGALMLSNRRKLYLGDEPGLGKTRTALAAVLHQTGLRGRGMLTVGVICPAIVRPHWRNEAQAMGVDLARVSSYNAVVDEGRDWEILMRCDILIVDEAHFCKHRESKRSTFIFGSDGIAQRVLDRGGAVWCLSGTPMPRNPAELFPVLSRLWPKTLANRGVGTYMEWLNRFCRWSATRHGIKVYGSKNEDLLREILDLVMVRRLVKDVASDLPPLRWGIVSLQGTRQADVLLAEAELEPEEREALHVGIIPPMSANVARYRHQIGDLKVNATLELLHEELMNGSEKIVVLGYHRSVLDALEYELEPYGVLRIDGDTTPTQREERVRQFQSVPARRVFLGQINACGTGLDGLQYAASEIVIVEPEWSRDVNVQAAHRLARLGQTKPVQVRMIALSPSLDEAIVKQFHRECEMVERIMDASVTAR